MATTTGSTAATKTAPKAKAKPKVRRFQGSAAAIRDQRYRLIQLGLFAAGAVLMPLGLLAIGLGWYGTSHSHYDYDQRTYLISGGILGLGLAFVGGFLYFGAWLAKMSIDQREGAQRLNDTLAQLAQVLSQQPSGQSTSDASADELVIAGDGTTVHRRDCPLIATRNDLRPFVGMSSPNVCRVCRPSLA